MKIYNCIFILFSYWADVKRTNQNPLDAVVEQTAFVTYENFKTYSWGYMTI
jgi:hypothetical protein